MPGKTNPFRKNILIVEDEPDTAEMLAEMIRLCGYEVLHTYSGKSALEMVSNSSTIAMILDVILPDLSGLEVVRRLRLDPQYAKLPVIIVSGNSHPDEIEQGLQAGASLYLTKPIGFGELKDALDTLLKQNKKSKT